MVTSDFRIWGTDSGNYFANSDRIIIFCNTHETLDDLLSTINHEYIHFCISASGEMIDDDQEERIIYIMSWAEEYLV